MKTNDLLTSRWPALLAVAMLSAIPARAVLPEPDNVLYGAIARDGFFVTAADYDVVVEVRRVPAGPAIAKYQMGSNPRLGDFYSVRVPLESGAPKTSADTTQTGDLIYLVVTDFNGEFATTNLLVGQRGTFHRIDLGTAIHPDVDGDGLPDAWELLRFGNLIQTGNGDGDGDGRNNRQEYIAGTNPNDVNDVFRLNITNPGNNKLVSFLARRAEGVGYDGYQRLYWLESTTNLSDGLWFGVPDRTNILGDNSTVTYQPGVSPSNAFYRARLSLQAP